MRRTVLGGILLALGVIALAAVSGLIALDPIWPVVLAAAVGLVPGGEAMTRVGAFIAGAAAAWVAFALRAAVLPDLSVAPGIALGVAIAIVTAVALASVGRLPLWAGLAGIAAMSGMYEMAFRAEPAAFLSESFVAVTSVVLAGALGTALAMVTAAASRDTAPQGEARPALVRTDAVEETL
jgi:hypothetical protein